MGDQCDLTGDSENFPTKADYIKEKVEERAAEMLRMAGEAAGGRQAFDPAMDDRFLTMCLDMNELGDGLGFAELHQGRFVYNASAMGWMVYNGRHWEEDVHGQALAAVEDLAEAYRQLALRCADKIKAATAADIPAEKVATAAEAIRKKALRRVNRLRSDKGRAAALKFARSNQQRSLSVAGEAFDLDPWLLAVGNGVIDLRTGEFARALPDQFISKSSPIHWLGIKHPAPTWERFLVEVFEKDLEKISFVHRMLGYAITGIIKDHIFPTFWGQGRNGKGNIIEVMKFVLGDYCAPVQAEMLLDQGRSRSAAAPSPDIMGLKGVRLVYAEETDMGRWVSTSRVKWITGGGTLTGRWPHDKRNVTFEPTHKLILLTNHRPSVPPEDFAFWERAALVEFGLSFVNREPAAENERRADLGLLGALKDEASGVLGVVGAGVPGVAADRPTAPAVCA